MMELSTGVYTSPIVTKKKQWSPEVSIARAIATLLVVFGHSAYVSQASPIGGGIDYSSVYHNVSFLERTINFIIHIIYTFHMPLFVFLSGVGYGIGSSSRKLVSANNQIISKFHRLIIPYLLFSLLWVIPIKLMVGYFSNINIHSILFKGIFLGLDAGHLWFLMMLFWIFVAVAAIARITTNWKLVVTLGISLCVGVYIVYHFGRLPKELFQIKTAARMLFFFGCGVAAAKINGHNICHASTQGYRYLIYISLTLFLLFSLMKKIPFISDFGTGLTGSLFVFGIAGLIVRFNFNIINNLMMIIDRHSFRIYLFHDPLNYLILAVFYNIGLLKFFGNTGNAGAASFVAIRFFGCLGVSILLNIILNFIISSISLVSLQNLGLSMLSKPQLRPPENLQDKKY